MNRLCGALLLLATIRVAHAEDVLKLDQLIQEAIRNNPELRAAQKRAEAARQRPRQEGALPDPTLSVGYSSIGGPLPGQGVGTDPTANIGFMVTQELPYPGKRGLMSARAGKEADAEVQSYLAAERSVVSRVKQAFHRLSHAYESIDVMRRSQAALEEFIKLSEARYAAGKATQQEIFRAQSQLAVMETRIVRMQQDLEMSAAELDAILHRPVDQPLERPSHDPPPAIQASLQQLTEAAEATSPVIAKEQKMAEARQLGVALARKNFYPDFAVSGGYYNMGSMPPMYQFRLDLKLPVWRSKTESALTEQVQSLEQARQSYEAVSHETRWKVKQLYIAAQASWRLLRLYEDSVMPQTELATASSLASFETGSVDSTQVLMNLMTRIDQEERYHEELLNYFLSLIQLEEITGLELL